MKNEPRLVEIINVLLEKNNNLSNEDKHSLIELKQMISSGVRLNENELEQIQDKIKQIAVKYYHDLDDLEKLIPPLKPNLPPRTAN